MRNRQLASLAALLGLVAALSSCGNSSELEIANNGGEPRAGCTPFGNPPRPQNDARTAAENSLLSCPGGSRLPDWVDPDGTARAACLYDPGTASAQSRLPLLVFLQSSATNASLSLLATNILPALATADLTGDPARPGFRLLVPGGRVTDRFYPAPNDQDTVGWDVWYRQFGSGSRSINGQNYPLNADFAALDHFIDEQIATGLVDTDRIYVAGWSNGAGFALQYGQNREQVAAVAMYSTPNPYNALSDPCPQTPRSSSPRNDTELRVSHPDIPAFHIQNNCDIYASCPSGLLLRDTLVASNTAQIRHQIITAAPFQLATDRCIANCGTDPRGTPDNLMADVVGVQNQQVWPSSWTDDFFTFLRENPR